MAVLWNSQGAIFRPVTYQKEEQFERDVVKLADHIFGATSIYVDIKKRVGNGIVTIPDGYLIDTAKPDEPKLFVVENEIAKHDTFKHIGIQMLKFVTSFEESGRVIRSFLMDGIKKQPKLYERLEKACKESSSPNIDHYLDRVVYAEFKGLVVIDDAEEDLFRVLEKINANISVLELRAFESATGERQFQFDTLYDEFDDEGGPEITARAAWKAPEERAARRLRRAASDTIVVPAREEGFQETFIGENQWRAIRISAAMKDRIKYIAAYRVSPISAITHIAKVKDIKPFKDTGKYQVFFDGKAQEFGAVKLKDGETGPQGPFYVKREELLRANTIDEMLGAESVS